MVLTKYEVFGGKHYVSAECYDKILYQLRDANEKIYHMEKSKCENKELKSQCECLKKEIEELRSDDSELIDEPIKIVEKLIYATRKYPVSQIQKALGYKGDMVDVDAYDKSDLRQIAKHLLVYCDSAEDEE